MSEKVLTKTLKDGSLATVWIEPSGSIGWQFRVERAGALLGVTQERPNQLKGNEFALTVIPGKIAIGITRREADDLHRAIDYFVAGRKKAAAAAHERETAELAARLRAAAPDADTWTISSPYGAPAVGEVLRVDGVIVTSLRTWRKYYHEDGMSFGADDDAGYVHYADVRQATHEEAAPILEAEEAARQRTLLLAQVTAEIVTPAQHPAGEEEIPDLLALSKATIGEPLVHLRVDRRSGMLWVLRYNGADGDNWAYNNYRSYVARRVVLTPERAALVDMLGDTQ